MPEEKPSKRPQTQADQDYDEHYASAENYYGGPSRPSGGTEKARQYDDQAPAGTTDSTPEPERSYDKHHYTDDELSRLSPEAQGNDEWFASGAGVDNEPFERSWAGARSGDAASVDHPPTRPASGTLLGPRVPDRRTITRRDIPNDPFVRIVAKERRINTADRRVGTAGTGSKPRKGAPARFQ